MFNFVRNINKINVTTKLFHVKQSTKTLLVPEKPVPSKIDINKLPPKTTVSAESILLLERLSLVDCANKQSIGILEDAIEFADQIQLVDTTGVEPLITVLEDR